MLALTFLAIVFYFAGVGFFMQVVIGSDSINFWGIFTLLIWPVALPLIFLVVGPIIDKRAVRKG